MAKIICLMGKSASGKDTIYKRLMQDEELHFEAVVPYTTRPIREKEADGREYHFTDEKGYTQLKSAGLIIEERSYDTALGLWRYFTVRDERFEQPDVRLLLIGTLDVYKSLSKAIAPEDVLPIYIETDDGERLARALKRERKQEMPKYVEMCRRFLADDEDFSDENLRAAGVSARFENSDLDACLQQVKDYIATHI